MARVELKNINKKYGDVHVLHDINLDIKEGEFVVFVGPSGCGKSTLLRTLAGLEEPSTGDIYLDNRNVVKEAPADREVAMVFQSYALYPQMTVRDNMSFGLRIAKKNKAEIDVKVEMAAQMLKLDHLLDRKPKELSGGQRQRVAIGRAIVRNPKLFLFDEPLSNLDAELRVDMRVQISKLHDELKSTMVYVTHDQVEAMTLADKIVVLRDGKVEQVGAPMQLYHHPVNQFVAGFIGSPKMNFLDVRVMEATDKSVTVALTGGDQLTLDREGNHLKSGDDLTLGIRPEHISLDGSGDASLSLTLDVIENLGAQSYVHCSGATIEKCIVLAAGEVDLPANSSIKIGLNAHNCHLFDQKGLAVKKMISQASVVRDSKVVAMS
ncbi:ABC transporter ATP-binding protein [Endozoicomonas arenosclerae]|uniref:ABC transporter ATP-binding protein n=1 Tax=Endozoicomonas arenosclerae TaxID=1633495 RepID=UPI000783AE2D|nr:sn-glycerol-3-phosphate ABC transporter ATP-binding protein UgpC [Endozoicomonas arenosclerae]